MTTLPPELVGEFIDAAELDQSRARELLQKHPDLIQARWIHGETLGHDHIAKVLLRHGANPNAVSKTRDNALHCAVQRGYEPLIRLLLEAGADPRYRTDLDESVFDALPAYGPERESILAILAEHGVTNDEG
jgi:ankyrin repeat protein